ncbi:hypothetical protein [Methyloversatilis sp. XJ19-49]|uniref:hypothetical protein n=1 Tax=Methyloversatilis sp. XJ19-49 TaxID=2963429 RepID=UPI00211BBBC5|nr:hypothetical protein [Methyloversatilis sp. XJ19-49]MCQ9377676.1 hypothetical protein [Methyloversatilis sp. XJ19-49]
MQDHLNLVPSVLLPSYTKANKRIFQGGLCILGQRACCSVDAFHLSAIPVAFVQQYPAISDGTTRLSIPARIDDRHLSDCSTIDFICDCSTLERDRSEGDKGIASSDGASLQRQSGKKEEASFVHGYRLGGLNSGFTGLSGFLLRSAGMTGRTSGDSVTVRHPP